MASVLQKKNFILLYSKNFFFWAWKFDEPDLKSGNRFRSSEFQLVDGKTSFLEVEVHSLLGIYIYLWNPPENIRKDHFTCLITDKTDSIIHHTVVSKNNFITAENKIDLLKSIGNLPQSVKYPVVVTCISFNINLTVEESSSSSYDSALSHNLQQLSTDFKKILDLTSYSDIVLNVDGGNIKAHKMILQARSPVFHKMFTHDIANTPIAIPDIGLETMKKLLHFIYTGTKNKCSFEENLELYYAADKYEVISLRDCCRTDLMDLLNVSNACTLFALAKRHSDEDFEKDVVKFISANFKSVVESESFDELSDDVIKKLIRLYVCDMEK